MTRTLLAGLSLLVGLSALTVAWRRFHAERTVPVETGKDVAAQLLNGELDALARRLEDLPTKRRPFATEEVRAKTTTVSVHDRLDGLRRRLDALEETADLRSRMVHSESRAYELPDLLHSWRFYSRLALTSSDPILRAQALLRISELPSGPALIAPYSDIWLRDAYSHDSEAGVMLAACAWALPRDRRVRARLLEWVRTSQYPGQRAQALRSLEGYMDESILAFVERAEHDASAVVRERARELMYRWYRKLNPKMDDD